MTPLRPEVRALIDAARAQTESYATDKEFRIQWLGLTPRSRDYLAQQIQMFGELVGSVTPSLEGWRILDVGCGDGRWLRRMVDYGADPADVVGIDISDVRFKTGVAKNPLISMLKTDGEVLPFKDASFDLVTQFVCFSNIPTDALRRRTAGEVARVLRPGGYVFWWELLRSTAASDVNAPLDPADYFDWPISQNLVGQRPRPSATLRPMPGLRWLGRVIDILSMPPTHKAALIGPKP